MVSWTDKARTCGPSVARTQVLGFTLVELLVVLAVVAMMAAVAIPGFSRMGLFSKDKLGDAARDAQGILSAARIYAMTNHCNTAVVFEPDPITQAARMSMLVYQPQKGADYLPVDGTEGKFRLFPEETCLYPWDDPAHASDPNDDYKNMMIFETIPVDFGDKLADPPVVDVVTLLAIVFQPSGRIETNGKIEKYRLRLAYTEEADPALRFYDDAQTQERLITIELQRSTGRARVEEDDHE